MRFRLNFHLMVWAGFALMAGVAGLSHPAPAAGVPAAESSL